MGDTTKMPLCSSEISGIWNSYIGENQFVCLIKYFTNRVDDNETRDILQYALDLSNQRMNILTNLFKEEKLPVPKGFTDEDVDINAPRLFTDTLYLQYLSYASRVALRTYSVIFNRITRSDIRACFAKCILESIDLSNRVSELSLSKGIFIRAPHIEVPKEAQYIKSDNFMFDWFGKKRSLLTDEITHIFSITNDSIIRRALIMGFGQVCKDKKISNYISRVLTISAQQNKGFNSILMEEDLPLTGSSDSYVTDSTISPFSNKLMLNKILIMYRVKIGNLGIALADISRGDLNSLFMKYMNECTEYAQDAASILIDHGWLEQPPQAINHKSLARV